MMTFLLVFGLLFVTIFSNQGLTDASKYDSSNASYERMYYMKKLRGAGCPYTASWLINVSLFRRLTWWLDLTKMEAASFNVYELE